MRVLYLGFRLSGVSLQSPVADPVLPQMVGQSSAHQPAELLQGHGWAVSCPHLALASCVHWLGGISLSLKQPQPQLPKLTGMRKPTLLKLEPFWLSFGLV